MYGKYLIMKVCKVTLICFGILSCAHGEMDWGAQEEKSFQKCLEDYGPDYPVENDLIEMCEELCFSQLSPEKIIEIKKDFPEPGSSGTVFSFKTELELNLPDVLRLANFRWNERSVTDMLRTEITVSNKGNVIDIIQIAFMLAIDHPSTPNATAVICIQALSSENNSYALWAVAPSKPSLLVSEDIPDSMFCTIFDLLAAPNPQIKDVDSPYLKTHLQKVWILKVAAELGAIIKKCEKEVKKDL
jgi:hypothetical protein